ncbi:MAG: hypothetical protein JXR84_26320 [Anaerolineae bacterium]|nr:hypothetical protein [Anaerolineae bacterium]
METLSTERQQTFRPTTKRLLLVFAGLPVFASLLGFSLRLLMDYLSKDIGDLARQGRSMLIGIPIYVILAGIIVLLNKDHFAITITTSTISGPSTDSIVGETTLSLDQLDLDSINQITFWDKFWLRRRILSKHKEKIVISRLYYSKAQENEIIATLLSLAQHQSAAE